MKLSSSLIIASGALAQASVSTWGQCGGKEYAGETACVSGSSCREINEWYSQCVPGAPASGTAPGSASEAANPSPTSSILNSTPVSPTSTALPNNGGNGTAPSSGFSSASGTKFVLNGVDKHVPGTNSYWISFLTKNDDVDMALDALVASGLKVLRIWGFRDVNTVPPVGTVYFQHLATGGSTINTGEDGLQRLDYIVSAAEKRGIQLIIPFVNYWDDFGGMNAYVKAFGGSKTSWYTNTAAQTQYKAYVKAVVSRYADSSAIFAWELANEPRCNGCDTTTIYNWAADVSAYVKSLDSNHMVTLGDEGFGLPGDGSYPFQYGEGVDFVKNLEIATLDFGTFHMYPTHWDHTDDWGNSWITAHAKACVAAGKPCLLEEYGYPDNHCAKQAPWQKTALETEGIAADLFWQFGVNLSTGATDNDGFTIYDGTEDWTCLVEDHVAAIR